MPGLVYIKTFGCQMNEYDSGKMHDVLEAAHGMARTEDPAQADVLLVNTCSVREKAQEKVFSLLGEWRRYKEQRPHVVIGVGGCVASQEGEGITARAPYVDLVFGPQTLHRLPEMLRGLKQTGRAADRRELSGDREVRPSARSRARTGRPPSSPSWKAAANTAPFAWCHIPAARKSAAPSSKSSRRSARLRAQGVREVTLLGQNVNAYAGEMDDGALADLATLIHFVAAFAGDRAHPLHHFASAGIQRQPDRGVCEVPKLNNLLHLPVQSGSDRILAAMKRGHTVLEYKQKLRKLRAVRPDISISTDIIVGFPGRDGRGFCRDHEPHRGRWIRSILQLPLQPASGNARRGLAG